MEKTIFDIMTDDMKKIEEFKTACDILLNTQYILADSKITAMLQTIATSRLLYSLFDDLLRDFDYRKTAKTCMVDGSIKMPTDPRTLAAFVFCILLDMDKKAIELKDFLHFFDRTNEINTAYECFLNEVIAPFKHAVNFLITMIIEELNSQAAKERQERKTPEISLESVMSAFIARIQTDETINDIIKDYMIILCNDMIDAVHKKEATRAQNIQKILHERLSSYKPLLCKELEKINVEEFVRLEMNKKRRPSAR